MKRMRRFLYVVLLSMAAGGFLVFQSGTAGAFAEGPQAALTAVEQAVTATLNSADTAAAEGPWRGTLVAIGVLLLALLGTVGLAKKVLGMPVRGMRSLAQSNAERRARFEQFRKYMTDGEFRAFLRDLERGDLCERSELRPLVAQSVALEAELEACTTEEQSEALALRNRLDHKLARIARLKAEAASECMAEIRKDLERATDMDEDVFQRMGRALKVAASRVRHELEIARRHEEQACGLNRGPVSLQRNAAI